MVTAPVAKQSEPSSWSSLTAGAQAHLWLKLLCNAGLGAWIGVFYFSPQRWPLFDAHAAPTLRLDEWVPFNPGWALIYQSVFVANTVAIWLAGQTRLVWRYTLVTAATYAASAVVFWLYPTLSPRPEHVDSALYSMLISAVDGTRNALPSLHAALGLLAAMQTAEILRRCRAGRLWRSLPWVWLAFMLYATLATRQHRVLDLIAGMALARAMVLLYDALWPENT